ncbi:unnamed protein product [Calypogeia fissa]
MEGAVVLRDKNSLRAHMNIIYQGMRDLNRPSHYNDNGLFTTANYMPKGEMIVIYTIQNVDYYVISTKDPPNSTRFSIPFSMLIAGLQEVTEKNKKDFPGETSYVEGQKMFDSVLMTIGYQVLPIANEIEGPVSFSKDVAYHVGIDVVRRGIINLFSSDRRLKGFFKIPKRREGEAEREVTIYIEGFVKFYASSTDHEDVMMPHSSISKAFETLFGKYKIDYPGKPEILEGWKISTSLQRKVGFRVIRDVDIAGRGTVEFDHKRSARVLIHVVETGLAQLFQTVPKGMFKIPKKDVAHNVRAIPLLRYENKVEYYVGGFDLDEDEYIPMFWIHDSIKDLVE